MALSREKINRLTSASLDLENCLRFLIEIEQHWNPEGYTVREALLVSAVIFYARPFSGNEQIGSSHPSHPRVPESVKTGLSSSETELHEKVINLRNKAVAHAEWSYHWTDVTTEGIVKAVPFSIWRHFQRHSELAEFRALAHKVREAVQHEKANELRDWP